MSAQQPSAKMPTREEVGNTDLCWVWSGTKRFVVWSLATGKDARWFWSINHKWLPYDAIYDPTNPHYPNTPHIEVQR